MGRVSRSPCFRDGSRQYSYLTNEQEPGYWKNYGQLYTNTVCANLDYTIQEWMSYIAGLPYFGGAYIPLIITEINYSSIDLCYYTTIPQFSAAYLMDLFTWEYDHFSYGGANGTQFPLRTIWYNFADSTYENCGAPSSVLGLFYTYSNGWYAKEIYSPFGYLGPLVNKTIYLTCPNWSLNGSWSQTLSTLYDLTALHPCY